MNTKDEYRKELESLIRLLRKKMRYYIKHKEFKENYKINSYIMKIWKKEANNDNK